MDRTRQVLSICVLVCLEYSAIAAEESFVGLIKEVDAKSGTIKMAVRSEKAQEVKSYTVAKDARIRVNGQPKKLEDLVADSRASVKLNADKKITEISVRTAGDRPGEKPKEPGKADAKPAPSEKEKRIAEYAQRQKIVFERSRQQEKEAIAAASARRAPEGPKRDFFVNNATGDDKSSGLAKDKAVRTLSKAVSILRPGDTLHLAVTNQPYRETLRFADDFGGVPGKPIVIERHGATLTGCDPLRLDGWVETGTPGLYKSTKFISELEEFTDEARLMRVFLLFDGVMQNMGRSSEGKRGSSSRRLPCSQANGRMPRGRRPFTSRS